MTTPQSNQAGAANWRDLCALSDVPADGQGGKYVAIDNRGLAVFRVGPEDSAIKVFDNACPHAGGSLAGGYIDEGCVFCPWHHWSFDAQTGAMPDNPRVKVRVYPSRVVDGRVQVCWIL